MKFMIKGSLNEYIAIEKIKTKGRKKNLFEP